MNWLRRYRRRCRFKWIYDRRLKQFAALLNNDGRFVNLDGQIVYLHAQRVGPCIDPRHVVTPTEMVSLVKMSALLSGEHYDRVSFDELQEALSSVIEIGIKHVPENKRAAFLAEIRKRPGPD